MQKGRIGREHFYKGCPGLGFGMIGNTAPRKIESALRRGAGDGRELEEVMYACAVQFREKGAQL